MIAAALGIVGVVFAVQCAGGREVAPRAPSWAALANDERPRMRELVLAIDDPRSVRPIPQEAAAFALALKDEGLACSAAGDVGGAVRWLDRAREWAELCDPATRATVRGWRGQVLAGAGRDEEARVELDQALAWFRSSDDRPALARCLRHAAWLEFRSNAAERCQALLAEQLRVLDDARAAQGDAALLEERRENAFVAALLALDARDPERARREIERLLAADRRVLEILPIPSLLEVDERRVVGRGELISRLLDWTDDPRLANDAFTLALQLIESERARLLRRILEVRFASVAASTAEPRPPPERVAELCWFGVPRPDGPHLVLLARFGGERSFTDLGPRGQLESRATAFLEDALSPANSGRPVAEFANASFSVARELMGPALSFFEQDPPPMRVVISPEGVLGRLPFAALVLRPVDRGATPRFEDLPYLVKTSAVVMVPSRAILRSIAPPCDDDSVLLLSTPQLWYSQIEGEEVGRLHRRVQHIDGRDASTPRLVAALCAGRFGWMHLGCHAEADPTLANRSRLVLGVQGGGEPDRISAAEIANLPLTRGTRVVLSACGTATGDLHRGEGVLGVWRAFLAAGASSVVATLHDVDDRSAATVTVRIHAAAARGAPLAEAVRAAQLDWLSGAARPTFPRGSTVVDACHPSFWAAWVCVGNDGGAF